MSIELQQLKDKLLHTEGEDKFNLLIEILVKINYYPIDEADMYVEQMLRLARELNDDKKIIEGCLAKCYIYAQRGQLDLHKKIIFEALEIAKKVDNKFLIVRVLMRIGSYYVIFANQYTEALHYLSQALEIAESIQAKNFIPTIHRMLANTYGNQRQYEKSKLHSLLAIEGFKKNGKKAELATTYSYLANSLRDKNQAIVYAELALEINKEMKNIANLSYNYWMLSKLRFDLNQYEKAAFYARKNIEVAQIAKSPIDLLYGYSILIDSLLNMALQKEEAEKVKLLEEANQYCTTAEKLIDSVNDEEFIMSTKFDVKFIRIKINCHAKKYTPALQALQELLQLDDFVAERKESVYDYMHRCHKALGNFKEALHYYQLYAEFMFDKKDNESQKHAEKLQTEYETKEKEKEVERLRELEVLKTRFFTQITHELRTPLTLIQGPAQQILATKASPTVHTQAQIIDRNANRLLNLVNQLLDLSKVEAKKMELHLQNGYFGKYVAEIVQAFQALAVQKQIQLDFITNSNEEENLVLFDADKTEKILYNLLSNAFKFTPTQGRIICTLSLSTTPRFRGKLSNVTLAQIIVEDTGKGIEESALPHIFDRFYQVDSSLTRQAEGTGIGLALVKELTGLLEGKIQVDSKVGKGTTFTLQLPLQIAKEQSSPPIKQLNRYRRFTKTSLPLSQTQLPTQTPKHKKIPVLLLVEDNPDIHTYICSILGNEYILLQSYNGEEGLQMAQERIPDIIISDVMMPLKDGYQLCAELKQDERTSHIPVILLTAKAALQSRIEGFEQGADAYIAKPFHADELRLQSQNLLTTRNNLQRKYQQLTLQPQAPTGKENKEQRFLQKVIMVIEKYIDDETLNAKRLSELLYMSNSQLYRKIHALTSYNVSQFIRNIRLSKAKTMLENGEGNVSEIAFNVGLTPSYFSRSFAKEYGFPPKQLIQ